MSIFRKKALPETVEPLIFINRPINDPKSDVVGFSTQVNTICKAIVGGSTMIGVVADYGSGKSSITELLTHTIKSKPYKYPPPIKINMWDCLQNKKKLEEKDSILDCEGGYGKKDLGDAEIAEVTELTKSFLYQLASGKDKKHRFSSYINKRLSRNYGNISLSTSSRKFWICFFLAAIFYAVYAICSNDSVRFSRVIEPGWFLDTLHLFQAFNPLFLVISLLVLILGIIDTCLVFSHWKMQNVRETEINDVFDVYTHIIEHIKPFRKKKKQLIIIEDLDRVVEKSVIIGFLKELYRFQNSMQSNADRFVFIVSIKPEAVLKNEKAELNIDDSNVYAKLFDIIIPLKPIHYDDYDSILLELINSDPKKKARLEEIIGEKISGNVLPKSFFWIKKGENLTLRNLKDRLNHAIMIMSSRKSYKVKTAVNFEACAAVTYLESRYPNDYYTLIQQESAFAKLMSNSVDIINSCNAGTALTKLKEICKEQFLKDSSSEHSLSDDFIDDLCTLIYDGVFNYDFRMYFYTYPSGSHIKTTEERELCDMLLMPSRFKDYRDLDKIVAMVYADGDNNVVTETIGTLPEYPEVILMNETLLRIACETNHQQVALSVNRYIIEPMSLDDYAVNFWARVHNIHFQNKPTFMKSLVRFLVASFSIPEDIVLSRTYIIKAYGKDILAFKDVFLKSNNSEIPQITAEEIQLIGDTDISIELIDMENLTADSFDYISELLCSEKLCENSFEKALAVMQRYAQFSLKSFNDVMLTFMTTNRYANDELFERVYGKCDKNALTEYLNIFDSESLSDKYLKGIEDLGFEEGLSKSILQRLASQKSYRCILLAASTTKDFEFLDTQLENTNEILNDCNWIQANYPDRIGEIRYHLCVEKNDKRYFDLYANPFPLIAKAEYACFASTRDAINCINIEKIDENNYREVLSFIHERSYAYDEIVQLMRQLFDPSLHSNSIVSQEDLFCDILANFDFKALGIPNLFIEDRETVYTLVQPGFDLMNLSFDDRLRRLGCLIPSVEKEISDEGYYPVLVRELDELTPYTLEWMKENYISISLSEKLAVALKETGDFENYITASVLRENNMIIDESIPRKAYLNVYLNITEMYPIMSNHWKFLEGLQNPRDLKELSESSRTDDLIMPIYKVPQHREFFNFILNGKFSDADKITYLNTMGNFATDEDSRAFQILICEQKNMELMGDKDRYWHIWRNFWNKSHKSVFTRKWRERWESELGPL